MSASDRIPEQPVNVNADLGFTLEQRGLDWVVVYDFGGGVYPASSAERKLWEALQAERGKAVELKAFRICEHCNKEFEIRLFKGVTKSGTNHNFSNCTHCRGRNDVWIRVDHNFV